MLSGVLLHSGKLDSYPSTFQYNRICSVLSYPALLLYLSFLMHLTNCSSSQNLQHPVCCLLACVGAASADPSSTDVIEPGNKADFELKVERKGWGSRSRHGKTRELNRTISSENWVFEGDSEIICALNIKHTPHLKIKNLRLSYCCLRK